MKYQAVGKMVKGKTKRNDIHTYNMEYSHKRQIKQHWWKIPTTISVKYKHNRPDINVWDRWAKVSTIIEVSGPADIDISES